MNYREQKKFLQRSRIWGGVVCLAFLVLAVATRMIAGGRWHAGETVVFAMVAIATAVLMYYTPDYLHLSVTPERKRSWEIKIRWRIVAAVLVFGLLLGPGLGGRLFAVFAAAWLAGTDWLAAKGVSAKRLDVFFWSTDLALLFFSLIRADAGVATIALVMLAAAAHLAVVRSEGDYRLWALI